MHYVQMAQQKLEAARKDVAALQAAAGQGRAGDDSSEQAAAAEAALADRQRKLAGLEQRILELEDRIYAPLSEAVRLFSGVFSLQLELPWNVAIQHCVQSTFCSLETACMFP